MSPVAIIPFKKSSNPILSSVPMSVSRATIELGRHGSRWILMVKKLNEWQKAQPRKAKPISRLFLAMYCIVTQFYS